jgi:hypothetical protein
MFRLSSGTIDIDDGELRIGNLSTTRYPDIYMTGGTIDVSGGTLNISDALYSSSGTITQTGGNINVGGYTGSSTHSSTAKLYKSSGTINFTGGTFAVKAQYPSASYYSLQISSGVTVNSNANHTTVLDPSGENMYMDLNGKTLGTMTINNSGSYSVFAKDNFTLLGDLTINASGKLESMSTTGDITLNGGNFVNNGTFDLNSSDMTFTGSGNVTCGAITSNGAGTLVMNKASASNTLTLNGDIELNKLTLTTGLIDPNTEIKHKVPLFTKFPPFNVISPVVDIDSSLPLAFIVKSPSNVKLSLAKTLYEPLLFIVIVPRVFPFKSIYIFSPLGSNTVV